MTTEEYHINCCYMTTEEYQRSLFMIIEVDDNWHHKKLTELFQQLHIQKQSTRLNLYAT